MPERAEKLNMVAGGRSRICFPAFLLLLGCLLEHPPTECSQSQSEWHAGGSLSSSSSSLLTAAAKELSPKMNNIAGKALAPNSENRDA